MCSVAVIYLILRGELKIMNNDKKSSKVDAFFKRLLGNIFIVLLIAACVYKIVEKYHNIFLILSKTYTRFTVTLQWIDIGLFICLTLTLIIILFILNRTGFQKRAKDKKIKELEEEIEKLKNKSISTAETVKTDNQ